MFDELVHSDWSVNPRKRWMASAQRRTAGWIVGAPKLVGATGVMLDTAFSAASDGRCMLLGFDFSIGVPAAYGCRTGLRNFRELLFQAGEGAWAKFFDVARSSSDVGITQPFYPATPTAGVSRAQLVAGLGVNSFDDLLRICERRTEHRQAACSTFWTLGGNQVGRAALNGWQEIIRPALRRGASLWPFDGTLADLAHDHGIVLAEVYPAEAYRVVGAGFTAGQSKRRQADRRAKGQAVLTWAERHSVAFTADASAALQDGFGPSKNGEDLFDASWAS
jgi:hypothetical protein